MPDIATFWVPAEGRGDWAILGPDLRSGDDLATSVIISLFSDRRADPDDVIPDGSGNPRGWWGDTPDRRLGSKIWLIERAKQTEDTRQRAEDYIQQSLQWLIDDGVAESIDVVCAWQGPRAPTGGGFLGAVITISEPRGSATRTFNFEWAWGGVS